jgi:hypothetical protein
MPACLLRPFSTCHAYHLHPAQPSPRSLVHRTLSPDGPAQIYREIRDTNWEEEQQLKNGGRRPAPRKGERSPGRGGDRSPSPVHRVLTSIKRTGGMGSPVAGGRLSPVEGHPLMSTGESPLKLNLGEDDPVLGDAESDEAWGLSGPNLLNPSPARTLTPPPTMP